jgi:hypothetical protein
VSQGDTSGHGWGGARSGLLLVVLPAQQAAWRRILQEARAGLEEGPLMRRLQASVLRPPFVDDFKVVHAGHQKLCVAPFGI